MATGKSGLVLVEKTTTCKHCGNSELAWYKTPDGKWMLCAVLRCAGNKAIAAQIYKPHCCANHN